ncbi:MAG: hypothetical protein AB1797_12750 [bacterium]
MRNFILLNLLVTLLILGFYLSACITSKERLRPEAKQEYVDRIKKVAILPFEDRSSLERAGELAQYHLAYRLSQKGNYRLKNLIETKQVLRAYGVSNPGDVSFKRLGEILGVEGIIMGQVLKMERERELLDGALIAAELSISLFHCETGTLVWKKRAYRKDKSGEARLPSIISLFREHFEEEYTPYVLPVYYLINDMIKTLPQPHLTGEDLYEKLSDITEPF